MTIFNFHKKTDIRQNEQDGIHFWTKKADIIYPANVY